jgi:O-antigen/teichoic acid export membrane protein
MTGVGAQVAKNAISLAVARVVVQAGNALLFFFMGRRLGFDQLGIYAAAISFYQIVSVAGASASTYLVREVARQPAETDRLLRVLTFLALVGGGSLAALGTGLIALSSSSARLAAPVAVAALAVAPAMIGSIQEGVFVAYGRASLQTVVSVTAAGFNVAVGFALLAGGAGVMALLTLFVGVQVLAALVGHRIIRRAIQPRPGRMGDSLVNESICVVGEMRAYLGSGLLAGLFARPETLILALLSSPAQAGYYGAALKVVDLWLFVPTTLMVTIFPLLSRAFAESRERAAVVQREVLRALLAVSLPVGALTFVAAGRIAAFYGDTSGQSTLPLRILALNLTLYSLTEVFWRVLTARGDQARVLQIQLITTITRLLSGAVLIVMWAATGAAVATAANIALYVILTARQIMRDGSRIHLLRLASRPLVAAIAGGAVAAVTLSLTNVLVALPAGAAVYCALAWRLSIVRGADIASLRGRQPRPVADGG